MDLGGGRGVNDNPCTLNLGSCYRITFRSKRECWGLLLMNNSNGPKQNIFWKVWMGMCCSDSRITVRQPLTLGEFDVDCDQITCQCNLGLGNAMVSQSSYKELNISIGACYLQVSRTSSSTPRHERCLISPFRVTSLIRGFRYQNLSFVNSISRYPKVSQLFDFEISPQNLI